jgi:acyl-CoA synthetase (NDP forming)
MPRPAVVHSMSRDSPAVHALLEQGLPAYHTIDAAARALAHATRLAVLPPGPVASRPLVTAASPPPAAHPGTSLGVPARGGHAARAAEGVQALGYLAARELIGAYGVPFTGAVPVRDRASVAEAAGRLRAPYALKAAWLEHKSDAGGVVLGLTDAGAAARALDALVARLGEGEYVLEEMDTRTGAVELIAGGRQDPSFGPVVLVGLGGVQAELWRDVAVELAPVTPARALAMLRGLRGHAVLEGWRGRPPVAVEALAEAVAGLSRLLAERPDVLECEVNPMMTTPDGVLAVDALAVVIPRRRGPDARAPGA